MIFCEISSNNCFIIHLQSITLSFVNINELYTQTLFLKKLPEYIVFVDFPCFQILPKDTGGRFSSFFVFSEFFSCSKQDNSSSDSSGKRAAIVYKTCMEAMRMLINAHALLISRIYFRRRFKRLDELNVLY